MKKNHEEMSDEKEKREAVQRWRVAAQIFREDMTEARKLMYCGSHQYGVLDATSRAYEEWVSLTKQLQNKISKAVDSLSVAESLRLAAINACLQPEPPPVSQAKTAIRQESPSFGLTVNSDLLTPEQVAEQLGVSPKTLAIWRSARRYDLAYIKVGRLVRYKTSAVEAFIASRCHGGNRASEGDLLTPEQAAEWLGVSPTTLEIWRSARRYDLAYIKVGRLVRYKTGALEEFIANRSHGGAET